MKSVYQWTKYTVMMLVVFVLLLLLNLFIYAAIVVSSRSGKQSVNVSGISAELSDTGGVYQLTEEGQGRIDRLDAFAMLIREDGAVAWSYALPEDVPTRYTLSEVASFSRWYLKDYPVNIWIREDGIFVLGLPKGSVWKHSLLFERKTMNVLLRWLPLLLLMNVMALILIPFVIVKRWSIKSEMERTEWIAGVSHDIRTPLSLVLGNAAAIQDSREEQEIRAYADGIEAQALRIRQLVANLNTGNKLRYGNGKWEKNRILVSAVIRNALCDCMNQKSREQYAFTCQIDRDMENFAVCADEGLFLRMLENLLHNAIQHNPSGCHITVSLSGEKMTVSDNGRGVDESRIRLLNRKVFPADLPEHGLGLRVVKQIADYYHWKIVFRSEKGKSFACEITFSAYTVKKPMY